MKESKSSTIEEEPEQEEDDGINKFKLKPPEAKDYNEDGTLKFKFKSKLMLKLEETDPN